MTDKIDEMLYQIKILNRQLIELHLMIQAIPDQFFKDFHNLPSKMPNTNNSNEEKTTKEAQSKS